MGKKILVIIIFFIFISGCAVEEEVNEKVVEDVQQEVLNSPDFVEKDISDLQEDFEDFLKESAEEDIEVSEDFINKFNSLLDRATDELEQNNVVEVKQLLEQAEKLLYDADKMEGLPNLGIWEEKKDAPFREKLCDPFEKPFEFTVEPSGTVYEGPLFDAHLHLTGKDSEDGGIEDDKLFINTDNADGLFAMFDRNGVIGMIGFLAINHEYFVAIEEWTDPFLKQTREVMSRHCGIIPFIFPDSLIGITPQKFFTTDLLDQYIEEYPIRGIGEIHVDQENPLYGNIRLNDDKMFELYTYAAENNLVVMIHPRESDLADLDDALEQNSNTIIILHGDEGIENIIPPLLDKHRNLYYSLDAGLMYPYSMQIADMTKEEFLGNLDVMYDEILTLSLQNWKPLIEKYPDRIMWGTDALSTWHFEVYPEVVRFGRDFIGQLDPAVQEKYAYKNAEELIAR